MGRGPIRRETRAPQTIPLMHQGPPAWGPRPRCFRPQRGREWMGTGHRTSDLGKLREKSFIVSSQISETEEHGGGRRVAGKCLLGLRPGEQTADVCGWLVQDCRRSVPCERSRQQGSAWSIEKRRLERPVRVHFRMPPPHTPRVKGTPGGPLSVHWLWVVQAQGEEGLRHHCRNAVTAPGQGPLARESLQADSVVRLRRDSEAGAATQPRRFTEPQGRGGNPRVGLGQAPGKGVRAASVGSVHGPLGPGSGPLPWAMKRVGCVPSGVPPSSGSSSWLCLGSSRPCPALFIFQPEPRAGQTLCHLRGDWAPPWGFGEVANKEQPPA